MTQWCQEEGLDRDCRLPPQSSAPRIENRQGIGETSDGGSDEGNSLVTVVS